METAGDDAVALTAEALRAALGALVDRDAVALPALGDGQRQRLLDEAGTLPFEPAEPLVGSGARAVRQTLEHCDSPPAGGAAAAMAEWLGERVRVALAAMPGAPCPPFEFNALALQRYPAGGGITAHRDLSRYRYLVAVLVLAGDGRFQVCADRSGNGAETIAAGPGDLILMRAPGFAGVARRPFHRVTGIRRHRVSLGMRHNERISPGA